MMGLVPLEGDERTTALPVHHEEGPHQEPTMMTL